MNETVEINLDPPFKDMADALDYVVRRYHFAWHPSHKEFETCINPVCSSIREMLREK